MNQKTTVITLRDLEEARERGMLSGEVRILKWGTIAAITVIFLFLTYLAQQINEVRSDLTRQINEVRSDLTRQINGLRGEISEVRKEMNQGQIAIHKRLTSVEQQLGLRPTSTEPASPAVADEQASTDITGRAAKPDEQASTDITGRAAKPDEQAVTDITGRATKPDKNG